MINPLKSIFNLDTILDCFISAIGYGVGYSVPNRIGYHPLICIISCLLLGTLFDKISEKILSNKKYLKSNKHKIIFAIVIYIVYLTIWCITHFIFDYDLDQDFLSNIFTLIIFQVISFIIKLFKEEISNIN